MVMALVEGGSGANDHGTGLKCKRDLAAQGKPQLLRQTRFRRK